MKFSHCDKIQVVGGLNMRGLCIVLVCSLLFLVGCEDEANIQEQNENIVVDSEITKVGGESEISNEEIVAINILDEEGMTLEDRFNTPKGYKRIDVEGGTFAKYLRTIKLKSHGSEVKYYNGQTKGNKVHAAVIDIDVGERDLQQCADSIIRLRAEYLYGLEKYDHIAFDLTNGFNVPYKKWSEGYRVKVVGNNTSWVKRGSAENSYEVFRKYLDFIYAYAGTLSLSRELKHVEYDDMQIGDVLLQGGSPGHAIVVMDMAINEDGDKIYMLAQGYMPAQDMHILKNMNDEKLSPWYKMSIKSDDINTPEWSFSKNDLHRF